MAEILHCIGTRIVTEKCTKIHSDKPPKKSKWEDHHQSNHQQTLSGIQPQLEKKDKMEATNPNVITFLGYDSKSLQ